LAVLNDCINLQALDLSQCEFDMIPPRLLQSQWTFLKRLSLSNNNLTNIPLGFLSTFVNLVELDLSHNGLSTIPQQISNFKMLHKLDLSDNVISSLPQMPEGVETNSSLKELILDDNPLDLLPPRMFGLHSITKLSLKNVNVANIPERVLKKGTKHIIEYLNTVNQQETIAWHKFKLCLCGKEGVGKTTLFHVLTNKKKQTRDVATDGIQVRNWELKKDGLSFNVFDMAGQIVFYQTHV